MMGMTEKEIEKEIKLTLKDISILEERLKKQTDKYKALINMHQSRLVILIDNYKKIKGGK